MGHHTRSSRFKFDIVHRDVVYYWAVPFLGSFGKTNIKYRNDLFSLRVIRRGLQECIDCAERSFCEVTRPHCADGRSILVLKLSLSTRVWCGGNVGYLHHVLCFLVVVVELIFGDFGRAYDSLTQSACTASLWLRSWYHPGCDIRQTTGECESCRGKGCRSSQEERPRIRDV